MIGKLPRRMPCPGRHFFSYQKQKDVFIKMKETKCPSRHFMVVKMKGTNV